MNTRSAAIIIKDNKILLMRRVVSGRGEYWVFPGGGVEVGETSEQALAREVQEELSLEVTDYSYFFELYNPFTLGGKYPPRTDIYYLVTGFTGEVALGGEERARMNDDDQYYPTWVELSVAQTFKNWYPEDAKQKFFEMYKV
jgi:mutator protein MutT